MRTILSNVLRKLPYVKNQFHRVTTTVIQTAELDEMRTVYEPDLLPPLYLMRQEGIEVLEEWLRWAEEWSMLLRLYGKLTSHSKVLEIGCGLGRTAYPLRYILAPHGSYDGFEICQNKVEFLEQTFHKAYPNFRFIWANVHNTYYNPAGETAAREYVFPYPDNSFDIVYAASVFTHMLPEAAANYFKQASRVLKPDGRCLFSLFLFDNYRAGQARPSGFSRPNFNFDYEYSDYGRDFAIANPDNPEEMTAYSWRLIEQLAYEADLEPAQEALPGMWSGSWARWISTQDLVILKKRDPQINAGK